MNTVRHSADRLGHEPAAELGIPRRYGTGRNAVDSPARIYTPAVGGSIPSAPTSKASTAARAKMVLVGDAYQLAPVKARGGMFEHLCKDLPWSQRLSEVWRLRDAAEREASLALRSARGNRLRKAIGWYRTHDRLHTGDAIAMAADATTASSNPAPQPAR